MHSLGLKLLLAPGPASERGPVFFCGLCGVHFFPFKQAQSLENPCDCAVLLTFFAWNRRKICLPGHV
jgi:hypothetical protein